MLIETELGNAVYALRDTQERERRLALLQGSHIAPLTDYVNRLRAELGYSREIPYFDPLDGGVNASLLFLLEAPGPKAVASGFISRENPDPTARNIKQLLLESGIQREETVLWNIVPWYVGDSMSIRPVNQKDINVAVSPLRDLHPLLPNVRVVVLVGRKAQRAQSIIEELFQTPALACPHPSQRLLNIQPEKRDEIRVVFEQALSILRNAKQEAVISRVWFTPSNPLGGSPCPGENCPLCARIVAAHEAALQPSNLQEAASGGSQSPSLTVPEGEAKNQSVFGIHQRKDASASDG